MDVLLVTATWGQDLDRLRLLRRSLREVGSAEQFHHVIALHTEDAHLAGDLRRESNVDVVLSKDLLSRNIERRRAAAHFPRTSWRHWVRGGPRAGWYVQQLTKLAAASQLGGGAQAVVFLDSDLVALQPIQRADFISADGKTKLFVSDDMRGDGSAEWNNVAAALLNVPPELVAGRQFIHAPAVVDVHVVREMLQALRGGSSADSWQSVMLAANAFEYPTYGAWAVAHQPAQLHASNPLKTVHFTLYEDMWDFASRASSIIGEGLTAFVSVQSRLHIPPETYEHIVAQAWS